MKWLALLAIAGSASAQVLGVGALDTSVDATDHHTFEIGKCDEDHVGACQYWDAIPSVYYDPATSETEPLEVPLDAVLEFKYSSGHNVLLLPSEEAFANCDTGQAEELAGTSYGGGDSSLTNNYKVAVTQPGTLYIVCGLPYHCAMGQKVQVNVVPPAPPPAPSRPPVACS